MKITAKQELALIDLLLKEFINSSRSSVKKIIQHGNITVNGKEITNPVAVIHPDDQVEYTKFKAPENTQNAPFPVLFEDDSIIVVEKRAGLLTYGERGTSGTSLYMMINDFLRERSKGKEKIFVVHRLDREVSGILVFAKSEDIQEQIKDHWKETEKRYYAFVEGKPPQQEGTISSWLKENKAQRVYTARESPDAKFAVTHYKVIKEHPEHTLLEINIETGRKHQIRVHLSDLGCPIVGDRKYGADDKVKRRIRLHAFFLAIPHPVTGERMEFQTRMTRGFQTLGENDEHYK
jgi:23S rRNA pseudouridine1911/1915/1917 synthase